MKATREMGGESHLIHHRTPMKLMQEEITVISSRRRCPGF